MQDLHNRVKVNMEADGWSPEDIDAMKGSALYQFALLNLALDDCLHAIRMAVEETVRRINDAIKGSRQKG